MSLITSVFLGLSHVLAQPCDTQARIPSTHPDSAIIHVPLAADIHVFRVPYVVERWTTTNTLVVINDADVVVFDSNSRPSTACMVIGRIRQLTTKPVRKVINSHWHLDHWMGNAAYAAAYPGVEFIATTTTRQFMSHFTVGALIGGTEAAAAAERVALDSLARTRGTQPAAPAEQRRRNVLVETERFVKELRASRQHLPTLTYRDSLVFWSGGREFRLSSETGDALGSAVLFLPRERILATGDVLVAPARGGGHPSWTTNSNSIAPWYESLRALTQLGARTVVPGQGPVFNDTEYLVRTTEVFGAVVGRVREEMRAGNYVTDSILARLPIDSLGRAYYSPPQPVPPGFGEWVRVLARKAAQEALDGIVK